MQATLAIALFVALTGPVAAPSFQATDHGYVYQKGNEYICFDRGQWSAGLDDGGELRWNMFLWHDKWVYETLPGGQIESGPTLNDDGSLVMQGTFSAREQSPPVKYAYRIQPTDEGVHVRCTLEKTAPLTLPNGVWLHLGGTQDRFQGTERVWLPPSSHGSIATAPATMADRFIVELRDGRSLCLDLPGFRKVEQEGSQDRHLFRVNLLRGDFEPAEKPVLEYTISFAGMPERFPGAIEPSRQNTAIRAATADATSVAQYERLEIAIDLAAAYDNPFDPDDVRLDAVFTTPSGKQLVVPGFFAVEHRLQVEEGAEVMVPEGNGSWKVRYAPRELGTHQWQLRLRDRNGEVVGGEGTVRCIAGKRPGFLRTSKVDPHYLAFDNGEGFFAIGHNLPIYHTTGQRGDEAMRRFAAAGENFNRWWMSSSGLGIEWADRLGWYRQDVAARLDRVLDLGAELGVYYMMCMDTHQDFRQSGWNRNPFNASNGGPCKTPRDWFTNDVARRHYRNRLRYTVARWGYSTNVLCWEFGNEMEGWADSPDEVKLPWHKEMSDYLRSIDPFGHLITTSFWSKTGPEDYWNLENIDLVQTHCYTNDDGNVAEPVRRYCLHQWRQFDKPHIFGEFGIRSHSSTADKDPKGWAVHNSLWAGLASFAAGGPMPWWHENYLDPLDLYFHFTALAQFTKGLPLGSARWEMLATAPPEFADASRPPDTRDVVVFPAGGWTKPAHAEFTVLSDGTIAGERLPQQLLHGSSHRDIRNPPTFIVHYPKPGKFAIRIGKVSASGLLKVWIDDRLALEQELPCGEGMGTHSVFRPQWNIWETTYDKEFAVEVPAGEHRIRVENQGRDWVTVTGYAFTGCKVLDRPNVLVCGMKTDALAIVWIQNRDSSWFNHARDAVPQIDSFHFTAEGLPEGTCTVEWWETWRGALRRTEQAMVRDGRLRLTLPSLATDAAVKIKFLGGSRSSTHPTFSEKP